MERWLEILVMAGAVAIVAALSFVAFGLHRSPDPGRPAPVASAPAPTAPPSRAAAPEQPAAPPRTAPQTESETQTGTQTEAGTQTETGAPAPFPAAPPPRPSPPAMAAGRQSDSWSLPSNGGAPTPDGRSGTPGIALGLPIACHPGVNCWIAKYEDIDPTKAVHDYACGDTANDGHSGTDFAIVDYAAMRRGVAVLAAAAGNVAGVRDGVPDGVFHARQVTQAMLRYSCGNGVRLKHPGGWVTQYCHMRDGSIAVRPGQRVKAGQRLGLVGSSGMAAYPHLHFSVLHDNRLVDPFAGLHRSKSCGLGEAPLWRPNVLKQLPYRPTALYNAGFTWTVPRESDVWQGSHHETALPKDSQAIVLWAEVFWVRAGDRISFTIVDPNGRTVVNRTETLERTRNRWFGYLGRPRRGKAWPAGVYTGTVRLVRAGKNEEYKVTRKVTVK